MKTLSILGALMLLTVAGVANAAWFRNGVLVSNVCRAPSGAWTVYPAFRAQPVGTYCSVWTGEIGVVTAN